MPIFAGTSNDGTTTLASLVDETRRHLESYQRPAMNKLKTAVDAAATTLTFSFDTSQIQPGTYLEIDLELVYVWSVQPSGQAATVERGQAGSKAAAHAAGAVATLNPKFPSFAIVKAINDDLRDLSSPVNGLFAVRSLDLVGTAHSNGYDLDGASDFLEILDVRAKRTGGQREWSTITNYQLDRSVSLTEYPSGLSLSLSEGIWPGQTIRVLYKATFTPLLQLSDSVSAISGLAPEMYDLPPIGAAIRLALPREIRRNFFEEQGDSRRAEEVGPGAVTNSVRGLVAERQRRITAEAARLMQLYPERTYIPAPSYGWW